MTRADLVRYAGASGDFNPIHWNEQFATDGRPARRHRARHVHHGRGLRVVTDWAGDPGAVVEYGVRFTEPVVVPNDDTGAEIEVRGKVGAKLDDDTVRVDLTVDQRRPEGALAGPGARPPGMTAGRRVALAAAAALLLPAAPPSPTPSPRSARPYGRRSTARRRRGRLPRPSAREPDPDRPVVGARLPPRGRPGHRDRHRDRRVHPGPPRRRARLPAGPQRPGLRSGGQPAGRRRRPGGRRRPTAATSRPRRPTPAVSTS